MQDAYNTREGEVGKKNYKEEELIDWVHVQHDDSAKVVEATQAAIRYPHGMRANGPSGFELRWRPRAKDLAPGPDTRRDRKLSDVHSYIFEQCVSIN